MAPSAWADDRVTERLSTGPLGGNAALDTCNAAPPSYFCQDASGFLLSADGTTAVFTTPEQLTADDGDSLVDIYKRTGGVTTLVPTGAGVPALRGISADASSVFFTTTAQLVPEDTDAVTDVYASVGNTTTLISTGPLDNGNLAASFGGNTPDGSQAFFLTSSPITSDDTDTDVDLYERSGGTTRLVSRFSCPGGCFPGRALGFSDSGDRVAFYVGFPNTSRRDVYVSTLSGGVWIPDLVSRPSAMSSNAAPDFKYISHDGSRVYFVSPDTLAPGAIPNTVELYVHTPTGFELVSTGSPNTCTFQCGVGFWVGVSGDESHVYFTTGNRLDPSDTDENQDLYERVGNTTTLLTPGPPTCGSNNCFIAFQAASQDGSRVVWKSNEGGGGYRLFSRSGGVTTQIAQAGGAFGGDPDFVGASPDATRVIFTTGGALTADDTDPPNGCLFDDGDGEIFPAACTDVYAWQNGVVTLLSKGPSGGSGAQEVYPGLVSSSQDAQRVAFFTREALTPDDADGYDDLYLSARADNSLGYARPKGASPIFASLVPAFQPCPAANRTHGAPLAFGSCSAPSQSSPYLTVGTPDANGAPSAMVGWLNATVVGNDPLNPPDDADVLLQLSFKDVRRRSDLSDYTGELQTMLAVRRTDRESGDVPPTIGIPATTADFPFSFAASCAATASTSMGATCGVNTSADAVLPGAIQEGTRMIWALDRVRVYDGGPDGDADTADNSLFATQGVFVP